MARDVFISYHSADSASANRLCSLLERNGISCWMAPRDIPPGQAWPIAIPDGIRRSHVLLLLLSGNSKNSKQIAREVEIADKNGLRIVTFRLEDVAAPPSLEYFVTNLQWIDGFGGQFEFSVRKLIETIRGSEGFPAPRTIGLASLETEPGFGPEEPRPFDPAELPPGPYPGRRRLLLVLAGLLLAIAIGGYLYHLAAAMRRSRELDTAFKNGIEAVDRGDDANAVTNFGRVLQLDPDNANALIHRAEAYHHQGKDDLALTDVDRAIQIQGTVAPTNHLLKADVLKALYRYPEALTEYDAFLASHAASPRAAQVAAEARDQLSKDLELEPVTSAWLHDLDSGSPSNAWVKFLPARTKVLGFVKQRTFARCEQVPNGQTNCFYNSSFDKAPAVLETVVLLKSAGKWKVSGYGYSRRQP